jgi:hypothetical protein
MTSCASSASPRSLGSTGAPPSMEDRAGHHGRPPPSSSKSGRSASSPPSVSTLVRSPAYPLHRALATRAPGRRTSGDWITQTRRAPLSKGGKRSPPFCS